MSDDFDGLADFVKKDAAAAVAAPVPEKKPDAPAAPAESAPKPAEAAAPAPDAKPGETPAQAAARKKYTFKGKVAGEEKAWEFDEDDLDETKNTDGRKKLIERFQKAEDYDRPGGALDQAASKKAHEIHAKEMLDKGLWVRGNDGKLYESPAVAQYRAWREEQAKKAAAPTPPAAAPAAAEPTPRQKRITELAAVMKKEGLSAQELDEFTDLRIEEKLDKRAADAAAASRADADRAAEAQRAHAARDAQMSAEQQAAQARAAENQAEIDRTVESLKEKLRDPVTGKVEQYDIDIAKSHMTHVLLETRDWTRAKAAVAEHAERHSARLKSLVDRLPKTATAAPPAPVHPAGQPGDNGVKKDDGFDPDDPFPAGGLSHFAKSAR